MAWQLTTLAARAAGALGLRRAWNGPYAVARALGFAERGTVADVADVIQRVATRRLAALTETERFAIAKATIDLDRIGKRVIDRALASGAPVPAVVELAREWPQLGDVERTLVTNPVAASPGEPLSWGACAATQVDQTTCGAAVMAVMLMIGDPFVGMWVGSGTVLAGYRPPEVAAADRLAPDAAASSVDDRWATLQRHLHARVTRFGLGPLPWPRALGTPPWRVDAHTRFAGLRFRDVMIDDTNPADRDALVAHASAALLDGIPVPLYASGDSSRGLNAVVPRHVVLLVERQRSGVVVYEPGRGALMRIADDELRSGGVHRALGNWSHASWAVLPRARRR